MKTTRQICSFLIVGMLFLSACTEEQTGKSPEKIADKIEVDLDEIIQDTVSIDTIEIEKPIAPPPPEPVPPPMPPDPWPDPYPYPEPNPDPEPLIWPDPERMPEPPKANPIIDFVDIEPVYPGGVEEMMKFISREVKYPAIDREVENQGRVYVEFVVEKDGSLTNIKILRGVSETIDREAIRVVQLMPNWAPGEVGGKIVRCKSRLPIKFELAK